MGNVNKLEARKGRGFDFASDAVEGLTDRAEVAMGGEEEARPPVLIISDDVSAALGLHNAVEGPPKLLRAHRIARSAKDLTTPLSKSLRAIAMGAIQATISRGSPVLTNLPFPSLPPRVQKGRSFSKFILG